jgi:hypothetical protein
MTDCCPVASRDGHDARSGARDGFTAPANSDVPAAYPLPSSAAGLPFASRQMRDCNHDREPDNDGSARKINVQRLETPRVRCRNGGGHQLAPDHHERRKNFHNSCRLLAQRAATPASPPVIFQGWSMSVFHA